MSRNKDVDESVQLQPTIFEMIAEEEVRDRVFFRWSMSMAIAAHLVFFALNWNFLAFGGGPEDVEQNEPWIYPIKQVKFTPPPKQELPRIVPPSCVGPIPDPDPDGPEPLWIDEPEEIQIVVDEPPMAFPEPPPIEPQGPIRFRERGNMTRPVQIDGLNPRYPEAARAVGIQGVVVLECVIGKDGSVRDIKVLRKLPLGLTESAVTAVQSWIFEPSTLNGRPVEVLYISTVRFSLK